MSSQPDVHLDRCSPSAAGTRIFVQDSIYDEFVERATKKAKAWRVGNPFAPNTDQGIIAFTRTRSCFPHSPNHFFSLPVSQKKGALVSEEQFNKVMSYIELGKKEGAKLLAGGSRVGTKVTHAVSLLFFLLIVYLTYKHFHWFSGLLC
jgi:acyl-CoA reductase-like NAD-dependent aldehyde dehydrogenase